MENSKCLLRNSKNEFLLKSYMYRMFRRIFLFQYKSEESQNEKDIQCFPEDRSIVDGNGVYKSIGATLRNCRLEKFSTTKPRVSFVCAYVYAYRSHPAAGLSRILRLVISHKSENPRIDFRSSDLSGTLRCRIFFEPSTIKFYGYFSISSPFCKKKGLSISLYANSNRFLKLPLRERVM